MPFEITFNKLEIDPYLLGCKSGDGTGGAPVNNDRLLGTLITPFKKKVGFLGVEDCFGTKIERGKNSFSRTFSLTNPVTNERLEFAVEVRPSVNRGTTITTQRVVVDKEEEVADQQVQNMPGRFLTAATFESAYDGFLEKFKAQIVDIEQANLSGLASDLRKDETFSSEQGAVIVSRFDDSKMSISTISSSRYPDKVALLKAVQTGEIALKSLGKGQFDLVAPGV